MSTTNCVSIPETFHWGTDPHRIHGERAEYKVFEAMKKTSLEIPGLKLLFFHDLRVKGQTLNSDKYHLREMDVLAFMEFQTRNYVVLFETKSWENIKTSKNLRKKAVSQLRDIKDMLSRELNVSTEKIQTHVAWPFMPPTS